MKHKETKEKVEFTIGKSDELKILIFPSLVFLNESNNDLIDKLLSATSTMHTITFYIKLHEPNCPYFAKLKETYGAKVVGITKATEQFNLVFTFGGDGTLLWLNQFLRYSEPVPIVAVNTGTVGFLTPFEAHDLPLLVKVLEELVDGKPTTGDFVLSQRKKIDVLLRRENGNEVINRAINEVVIKSANNYAKLFKIFVDDVLVMKLQADAIVICNQSGSTAYNASLNGPVVLPDTDVLVINAIAPQNCRFRPLIISKNDVVRVELEKKFQDHAIVTCDSTENDTIQLGDSVSVKLSAHTFDLVCKNSNAEWLKKYRKMFYV